MENQKSGIKKNYTRYEFARIIGARALQIAMDAPILLKLQDGELKALQYDSIKIAEREFESGVLPITINRPVPKKRHEKLQAVKEEKISDEEILERKQEVEKEIVENVEEFSLVGKEDLEETEVEAPSSEEQ